jgi:hypothetical protein
MSRYISTAESLYQSVPASLCGDGSVTSTAIYKFMLSHLALNLAFTLFAFVPSTTLLKDAHVPVCHAASFKFPSIIIPAPHKAVTDDGAGLGVNVAVNVGDAGEPVGVAVRTGDCVNVRVIVIVDVGLGPVVLV